MGLLKPESLTWADQIENLKGQTPKERRAELKNAYDLSSSQITNLLAIKACFDQSAFDKVRQADKANPFPSANKALGQSNPVAQQGASQQMPFTLSFSSAQALAGLKKAKSANLSTLVHAALDVTLAQRLATKDIKNLVTWMIQGKPASEFDPKAKPTPIEPSPQESSPVGDRSGTSTSLRSQQSSVSDLDHAKLGELNDKAMAEKARGDGQTKEQEKLDKYLQKIYQSTSASTHKASGTSELTLNETMYDDWLADIKVIQQIKSKVRKGKPITKREKHLLELHKAGEFAGHGIRFVLRMIKVFFKGIHWVYKVLTDVLKEVGLYKYAKALFIYAAFFLAIWFAWEAFRYGVTRPVEMVWSKMHFHHEETAASEPTAVPTPQPQASTLMSLANSAMVHLKPKPTPVPKPVVVYQPAVSFIPSTASSKTLYDPKILELEIAAIARDSILKDYVFQPDEGMPADLAVSRLQDLTDADKYTMMIGGGKQKIESFTPSNTDFIITFKSTDPFGLLGGGPHQMNFFWEDVKYIHINEIDHFSKPGAQPDINYQCTVVSKSAKDSLTVQCASADDLENLVSALEYFIRHSRLGHDAQPAGMPYTDQGIQFNNDRVVTLLWANSPIDRAAVVLGEHLWSVGKNTPEQQSKKDLEAGLSTLPVTLFTASPAEWEKALTAYRQPGMSNAFHPKLRKVEITVP